jgi:predicted glycosyl hydrolase (DUF1957 family)
LAQASDWQFIISTGAAADYAVQRFGNHCEALAALLTGIESQDPEPGLRLAHEYAALDDCFADPLNIVRDIIRPR